MKKKMKDVTLAELMEHCEKSKDCYSCQFFAMCKGEICHFLQVWKDRKDDTVEIKE